VEQGRIELGFEGLHWRLTVDWVTWHCCAAA
jgi:hypothetical protein